MEPNRESHIKVNCIREFKDNTVVLIKKTLQIGMVIGAMWDWPNFDYKIKLNNGQIIRCWDYELKLNNNE